jgi:hypothetical protein
MTEEEKQQERKCKTECCERLAGINVKSYGLGQIDDRLNTYAEGIMYDSDPLSTLGRMIGSISRRDYRKPVS